MEFALNPFTNEFDAYALTNNSKCFEMSGFQTFKTSLGVDVIYTSIVKSNNITGISVSVNGSAPAEIIFPFKVNKLDELQFQVSYPQEEQAYFTLMD